MSRDYVERQTQIDVRDLHRRGALVPGVSTILQWNRYGEILGHIKCEAGTDKITLRYKCQINGQVEQEIYLEYTECTFGGRRPWFTCWCTDRVAVLYGAGKWFLCRNCHRLVHQSINLSKPKRAYSKMLKIRKRLDYDNNLRERILFKPKGMHYKTFRRLMDEYRAAQVIHSKPLINGFIRLCRKLGQPLSCNVE